MSKNGKWGKDKETLMKNKEALMHDLRRRREIMVEIESLNEALDELETRIKKLVIEGALTEHVAVDWQSLEEIITSKP